MNDPAIRVSGIGEFMSEADFIIGSRKIGGEELFFIVEEGCWSLGNFAKALSIIDAAANTGADAIEFQLLRAADFSIRSDPKFRLYESLEFTEAEIRDLVRHTKNKGMEFIAAALTDSLVDLSADAGCSAFNINASDLTNPDLLDAVAQSGRPFLVSLLLATEQEVDGAIGRLRVRASTGFGLLHGQHTMFSSQQGVPISDTTLGCIEALDFRYQRPVGFIDHTSSHWMPAVAVAAGAQLVTKHLTLSRDDRGPDWQICLDPEEMKQTITWSRQVYRSVHTYDKVLALAELNDRLVMRKSIVTATALSKGNILSKNDLAFKRPGTGISPFEYERLVGKRLVRDLPSDHQITIADVEPNSVGQRA